MAHPHDLLGGHVAEERTLGRQLDVGLAVLGDVVRLDGAAELAREELHAVTDPESRDPELEDRRVGERRTLGVDRRGPAGEDERRRIPGQDLVRAEPVRDELRVDPRLADAAGDQLAVLTAEVEHEHRALLRPRLGRGRREVEHLRGVSHGGSSALPS